MSVRSMVLGSVAVLAVSGCSEYGLQAFDEPNPPALDAPQELPVDEPDEPPVEADPTCDDAMMSSWSWYGSEPFSQPEAPADPDGVPFWSPDFSRVGFSPLALPDTETPPGTDRAYVAEFELVELPPTLLVTMQSDDGLWIWVNGEELGHWGGDWQMEGCVNEDAECLETFTVAPVDISGLLHEGVNVVAARVSNPVMNAWFDLVAECID